MRIASGRTARSERMSPCRTTTTSGGAAAAPAPIPSPMPSPKTIASSLIPPSGKAPR